MLLPLTEGPGEPLSGSGNPVLLELGKGLKERLFSAGELMFSKNC